MAAVSIARLVVNAARTSGWIVASRISCHAKTTVVWKRLQPEGAPGRSLPSGSLRFSTQPLPTFSRVFHDTLCFEFFIVLEPTDEQNSIDSHAKIENTAYLKYKRLDEGTVDLHTTFVPPKFEGQGVAAKLADAAFCFCLENNLKMKLSCPYLAQYVKKSQNSKYAKLLV